MEPLHGARSAPTVEITDSDLVQLHIIRHSTYGARAIMRSAHSKCHGSLKCRESSGAAIALGAIVSGLFGAIAYSFSAERLWRRHPWDPLV